MGNTVKRLTRSREDKWLGGVCGGLAAYSGIDASFVRIIVALATIIGFGSLVLVYLVAWALIAREDETPAVPGSSEQAS